MIRPPLILIYTGPQPAQHPHCLRKNVVWRLSVCRHHHGEPLPDAFIRGRNARDSRRIDAAVADDWCWRAEAGGKGHAEEAETEQRSRRRARQSTGEYELI